MSIRALRSWHAPFPCFIYLMNLKALLTHLLKNETPDEEERAGASQTFQATPSRDSRNTKDSEKVGGDPSDIAHSGRATNEHDVDLEHDDDREYDDALPTVGLDDQTHANLRSPRRIFSWILSSAFPSPSDEEEIQAYIPHYRVLPILSGITIPFCILLEIPGLTAHWFIRRDGSTIVASKPNPPLLDVGIALSILCAVLANVCLVVRFLERHIKTMTILCTLFLSIHDIINIVALATFGATKDGYTYGEAFWMTLCSTIASMFTNVTLIIDLIRIPDFKRSGSGLTRRQRSLVIIIVGLFCYLALGALVNSLLLGLTFINGLYFTVVTIETIGFGDIVPDSRSSRVFICFYATLGVINLAFVVGYVRESVSEGLDFGYRRRLLAIQERRRAVRRRRRAEDRWRHAVIWRLRERHAPLWIPKDTSHRNSLWLKFKSGFWRTEWGIQSAAGRSTHQSRPRRGTKLNLWALPPCQLEGAALEAGVPLDSLLPIDFYDTYDQDACHHAPGVEHHALPSWFVVHPVYHRDKLAIEPLTHRRLGAMAAVLTRLSLSIYEPSRTSTGSLQTSSSEDGDYRADVVDTEKKAYYTRSGLSWGWFLIFWMGGAAIFKATEGWTYGLSVYFCFIAFSTIGYGDLAPTTPAGRSIFVVWALVGVATMTIFISVVSEAYTSRYKGILGHNSFKHVVRQYRQRTKVELSEKVQSIGTSTGVRFTLHDTLECEETNVLEDESPPASITVDDSTTPAAASTSKPDSHVRHAQRSLEQLPRQILTETRSIQQYMQLIGDLDGHSTDVEKFVDETVWSLVDDIMGGRKLTDYTKMDILKDGESRQTLMMLGLERSLNELVNISEQAIAAIQERDRVIASLEREKEQDETEDPAALEEVCRLVEDTQRLLDTMSTLVQLTADSANFVELSIPVCPRHAAAIENLAQLAAASMEQQAEGLEHVSRRSNDEWI
ncbi:hypothetical protein J3R83DRAFT_10328 [Lanmaoa asiatica]|nr:hypothetical protein J3R83DRAFT_10328 [Lanmaoa asiatica]